MNTYVYQDKLLCMEVFAWHTLFLLIIIYGSLCHHIVINTNYGDWMC